MLNDAYTWMAKLPKGLAMYRPHLAAERDGVKATLASGGRAMLRTYLIGKLIQWGNPLHIIHQVIPEDVDGEIFEQTSRILLGAESPGPQCIWWNPDWETETAKNLEAGVRLLKTSPMFAKRDCDSCKHWWYNDETGEIVRRMGQPVRRPEGTLVLCQTGTGCPKGTPEKPRTLNTINQLAYQHFLRCDAIGLFPDDAIVARNAGIIRGVLATKERTIL